MDWDVIVVGAGIAGLGVGALLAKEGGKKVLVLERYRQPGGRLMHFRDYPGPGWNVDVGLHLIELGPFGEAHMINERVGKRVEWGPMSETVQLYRDNRWISIAELANISDEYKADFRNLTTRIASMSNEEVASWDGRSFEEWMDANTAPGPIRELLATFAMIMTTIPLPVDMGAGEVLHIARENLLRRRQFLAAGYPIGGMGALTRGLIETIEENGGEIRLGHPVEEVLLEGGRARGVKVAGEQGPYPRDYRLGETEIIEAGVVVCALPIYQLPGILDFSRLPSWWGNRILDIKDEITGLVGYMIGLDRPITDKVCFYSLLETPRAKRPFQAFPASNYDPTIAPAGKQLFHTDIVCEYEEASQPFKRRRLLELLAEDLKILFPEMESATAWRLPYYVAGCDGLARKPGLVGRFKPELRAPGIDNLYFAGDTYQGRGLATNSAARSAMDCAERIMQAGS
ncbi:MAG: NAD(P)/FAD-dependent oxidoreductase [Proteobacteria bacterium]|nr:NAD(P)/FAD-dependent oxidoreductase [Pseudomonadota bacterium]